MGPTEGLKCVLQSVLLPFFPIRLNSEMPHRVSHSCLLPMIFIILLLLISASHRELLFYVHATRNTQSSWPFHQLLENVTVAVFFALWFQIKEKSVTSLFYLSTLPHSSVYVQFQRACFDCFPGSAIRIRRYTLGAVFDCCPYFMN